jgi:Ethanolamine utilization protein EutJ (predicted chaperonin)
LYGGQSRESLVTDFLNHLQIAKRKIENLERQVTDGSGSK